MPIETFALIDSLNIANPDHTDGLSEADQHLRGIKATLKNTFPAITGTVTATHTLLNAAAAVVATVGTGAIVSNGTTTGAQLLLQGVTTGTDVYVVNTGTVAGPAAMAIRMTQGTTATVPLTLTAAGVLAASSAINAPSILQGGLPLIPSGLICLWSGLVTALPAGWVLCNGANGTPNLMDRFVVGAGSAYARAQSGGATGVTVTTSTTGSHFHGGATGAAGDFALAITTDAQGAHSHGGSTGAHVLNTNEIPAHQHEVPGARGTAGDTAGGYFVGVGGNVSNAPSGIGMAPQNTSLSTIIGAGFGHAHDIGAEAGHQHHANIAVGTHTHSIGIDGSHSHTATVATLPPYYALAYIMKQ